MQPDFSQSGAPGPSRPKPDFDQPNIAYPGRIAEMNPRPDHGEDSYRGLNRLSGKAAIITGADSGIGRAVAIAFAREGADIVLNYLPEEEADGAETARYIELAGRTAIKVPADLQKEENCHKIVAQAMEKLGRIDVLANIAAFQNTHESLEDFTTAEIDRTFKTNVNALLWLSKAVLPLMKPGSVIINTSSIQGSDPSPN